MNNNQNKSELVAFDSLSREFSNIFTSHIHIKRLLEEQTKENEKIKDQLRNETKNKEKLLDMLEECEEELAKNKESDTLQEKYICDIKESLWKKKQDLELAKKDFEKMNSEYNQCRDEFIQKINELNIELAETHEEFSNDKLSIKIAVIQDREKSLHNNVIPLNKEELDTMNQNCDELENQISNKYMELTAIKKQLEDFIIMDKKYQTEETSNESPSNNKFKQLNQKIKYGEEEIQQLQHDITTVREHIPELLTKLEKGKEITQHLCSKCKTQIFSTYSSKLLEIEQALNEETNKNRKIISIDTSTNINIPA